MRNGRPKFFYRSLINGSCLTCHENVVVFNEYNISSRFVTKHVICSGKQSMQARETTAQRLAANFIKLYLDNLRRPLFEREFLKECMLETPKLSFG